jgi:MerR family transcriptional regulator, thiopeptide resistance regulator
MYTVGQVARRFRIARSTLLYYDAIGLLPPSRRSAANYRLYSDRDIERMERIDLYRRAGLPLESIRELLRTGADSAAAVLERHLIDVGRQIDALRTQQQVIVRLLSTDKTLMRRGGMNKERWIALLSTAGLDREAMNRWHAEFERTSPAAHAAFLEWLGITPAEIVRIRALSRAATES